MELLIKTKLANRLLGSNLVNKGEHGLLKGLSCAFCTTATLNLSTLAANNGKAGIAVLRGVQGL